MFYKDDVRNLFRVPSFRDKLGAVVVDEVHLLAEWKVFRPAFKNWSWFRALIPTNVSIAACTATLAVGTHYKSILNAMGFVEQSLSSNANFKLIKLDTERYNIALHIRRLEYSVSGWKFPDLEWLILECEGKETTLWPKTIIYYEQIDLGHRVVHALRKLLPHSLGQRANTIIRHVHSLRCPRCKQEAAEAFGAPAATATCRIIVATDAFGMGIDIPDVIRVIVFRSPRTLSSAIQRIGRAVRDPMLVGEGIIYVDKSEVDSLGKGPNINTSNTLDDPGSEKADESEGDSDSDKNESRSGRSNGLHESSRNRIPAPPNESLVPQDTTAKSRRKEKCPHWMEVLETWASGNCFVQTINKIYDNPGKNRPCGRCSNCEKDEPREELKPRALNSREEIDSGETNPEDGDGPERSHRTGQPKWRRMTRDMKALALKELEAWSAEAYFADDKNSLFLTEDMMLPRNLLDAVVSSLLAMTDAEALKRITDVAGWSYWVSYGEMLAKRVVELRERFLREIDQKHEEEKQLRALRYKEKILEAKLQQAQEQAKTAKMRGRQDAGHKTSQNKNRTSAEKLRIKISLGRNAETPQATTSRELADVAIPGPPKPAKRKDTARQKRGTIVLSPGSSPKKKRTRNIADKENSAIRSE